MGGCRAAGLQSGDRRRDCTDATGGPRTGHNKLTPNRLSGKGQKNALSTGREGREEDSQRLMDAVWKTPAPAMPWNWQPSERGVSSQATKPEPWWNMRRSPRSAAST